MHTKAAKLEDAELVYAIKFNAYAEYAIRSRGSWDESFQRAYTKMNLPHTRLILEGSEVVGWIASTEDEAKFDLIDIHLLPDHQGKGIGSKLLSGLVSQADSLRKPIQLSVLKINPSRTLYERWGFRSSGETETHVLMERVAARSAKPASLGN